jgi:hypothetical protein
LRKLEGAEVLLLQELNFFRAEVHRLHPIAPSPPVPLEGEVNYAPRVKRKKDGEKSIKGTDIGYSGDSNIPALANEIPSSTPQIAHNLPHEASKSESLAQIASIQDQHYVHPMPEGKHPVPNSQFDATTPNGIQSLDGKVDDPINRHYNSQNTHASSTATNASVSFKRDQMRLTGFLNPLPNPMPEPSQRNPNPSEPAAYQSQTSQHSAPPIQQPGAPILAAPLDPTSQFTVYGSGTLPSINQAHPYYGQDPLQMRRENYSANQNQQQQQQQPSLDPYNRQDGSGGHGY